MLRQLARKKAINGAGFLWGGAFCCAVSAHIALLAACCDWMLAHDSAWSPPMAIMLSFAQTPSRPDIDEDDEQTVVSPPQTTPHQPAGKPAAAEPPVPAPPGGEFPAQQQAAFQHPVQQKTAVLKPLQKIMPVQDKRHKAAVRQISAPVSTGFSGARNNFTAESDGVSVTSWLAKVQSQLERQKNYLRKNRGAHHAGTVELMFSVAEDGVVQTMRLVHSTGSPELEQLALTILKRASPLPRPPAHQTGKNIAIPLVFR